MPNCFAKLASSGRFAALDSAVCACSRPVCDRLITPSIERCGHVGNSHAVAYPVQAFKYLHQ